MKDLLWFPLNLRLFGDDAGGEAAAPAAQGGQTAQETASASGENTPDAGENTEALTPEEEFDRLIRSPRYRDIYGRRVQNTLQQRLKGSQAAKSQLKSAQAVLAEVAQRYGVAPGDLDAIRQAVTRDAATEDPETEADDGAMEAEAMEEAMEQEALSRQAAVEKTCESWLRQGEALKAIYPGFAMERELEDPRFQDLLRCGLDVQTAFEALHMEDIRGASMAYAARKTREHVAKSIASGSLRPSESGVSGGGAVSARCRIENMSDEQINALCERAMRGGHITL